MHVLNKDTRCRLKETVICSRYLDEGEHSEHGAELHVELFPENGHRQARLHDRLADAVIDALDFRLAQLPQEDLRATNGLGLHAVGYGRERADRSDGCLEPYAHQSCTH